MDTKSSRERHVNIPVFIPHLGCPNDCVFCNQRSISGKTNFDAYKVKDEISAVLSTLSDISPCNIEIAFFGGSFTGIDRELMLYLLDTAQSFIDEKKAGWIRMSTRPDYISREILDILSCYSVKTIELGIQSMSDEVLKCSRRGHTSKQTEEACRLILDYGFELVGQMMIGLPGSTEEAELETARLICDMGAKGARIYPTMVLFDTELCEMTKNRLYRPLSLDEAIDRSASVLKIFVERDVRVIRIGLHSDESLTSDGGIFAGGYHPAMGELCESELYYRLICERLEKLNKTDNPTEISLRIPKGHLSKVIGNKKRNKERLAKEFNIKKITAIEDSTLPPFTVAVGHEK